MAKVYGVAGEHAGRQSVAAFKRMFATLLIVAVVAAFCEGAMVTMFFTTHIRIGWIGLPVVTGILLLWLLNYANRRVDQHETDRLARGGSEHPYSPIGHPRPPVLILC